MQNYPQNYRPYFNQVFYKVVPVMSENETNNITVDFNGTPTYFHNQSNNEIYIKQFDFRSGLTTVQRFVKSEHDSKPTDDSKTDESINIPKKDFEALNERLNSFEQMLGELQEQKGGKK